MKAANATISKTSTSAQILRAGRRILDREGIDGVSMRAVADAVGLTPMAIYRHFDSRAALLNALADEGFEALAAKLAATRLEGPVETRLMQLGEVFVEHALKFTHMYELMFLASREGARSYPGDFRAGRSPTFNPTVRVLEEAMRNGELRTDDALEIAFELSALSHGLVVLYRGGRVALNARQFRSFYLQSFRRYIDGLRR
jgi:AcrR family transcriptional regulator